MAESSVAAVSGGEAVAPDTITWLGAAYGALVIVGLIAVITMVLGFVFFVRWRTLRRLQAMMLMKSTEASADEVDAEAPQAATLVEPELRVFDDLGQLPGAVEARQRFVQGAKSVFRQALAVDLVAALAYAALPAIVNLVLGRSGPAGALTSGAVLAFGLALLFTALALLRYVLFRNQFTALDERSRLERAVMFLVNLALAFVPINVHPMTILQWLLAPRVQILLFAAWVVWMLGIGVAEQEPGLVLAAGVHVALGVWFTRRLQRIPGKRLVVLRVFGLDKNAQFLFDGVLAFWKHFGHFFTVVDPAFWRHSHKVASLGTLLFVALTTLVIVAGFTVYQALPGRPPEELAPLAAAAFALPLLGGYAWYSERQIDRTFIRSKAHLDEMLVRFEQWPRHLDMTYKSLETRCYDNTWKVAVAEFARRADAVVMDLRGYTSQRAGSAFEVNYLLDAVPLERIVFLLDEQSDPETIGGLVRAAWKELSADSPNLDKDAPEVRFYIAATRDARDIQGVIDLLISAAAQRAPAAA